MSGGNYEGQVVCGFTAAIGGNPARLPDWDVHYWRVIDDVPPIERDVLRACVSNALQVWSDVCGLWFDEWTDGQRLTFQVGTQFQGEGGVLADQELPYPGILDQRPLRMRIDKADQFVVARNPPSNRVGLDQVLRHEFGHGLGLDHGGNGMMRPVYSAKHWLPSEWEILLVQKAYGPPRPRKKKQPDQPTSGELKRLVEFFEESGRLTVQVAAGVRVRFADGRIME